MTEVLFWTAVGALAYTFAGYPAAVWLLARVRPRPVARAPIEPSVSVLIVAHNEALVIAGRIENCLSLDYPSERLEVVVASDGSTDDTAAIAERYRRAPHPGPAVRVMSYARWRGKPSVLNDTIPRCRGDIVVLADARQRYDVDAVRRLVENFADPAVGAASGELCLRNEAGVAVGEGVGAYWRYEKLIRRAESALDSTVGATGAIYAIRRELFEPIAPDTLLDDVLVPMRIARRGYRVVFDARARASDHTAATARQEYLRKVRTIGGNVQLFTRERWLLLPVHRLWVQAVSHKVLRLVAPAFMLTALATSAILAPHQPLYLLALALQGIFYAAAAGGALLQRRGGRLARLLAIPYAFCLLNLTTLAAIARSLTGRHSVQWRHAVKRAERRAA
ncbi:MAG TPA: glycosyltransferase family 2 protein [Methylomirabilota bacterium]|jgi:cellulose synthase/poly-beta-1,6-N-acetylglucosamine synthase-like glycosyltransferase